LSVLCLVFLARTPQGGTLDELNRNLQEVLAMLLEDGEPQLEEEFVGIQNVAVA
jgi:predicted RNase H-like HicB family nuclease